MDRKSIIALVVCFLVLVLWYPLVVNKLYPPKPLPPRSTNAPPATLVASNQPATPAAAPITPEAPVITTLQPIASTNVPEDLKELTNKNARYTFTSHGGGLKLIELLRYPETVSTHREKQPHTNRVATLNRFTPAPTLALLDGDAVQGDGIFTLTQTGDVVRAEKTLTNGLSIVKEFQPGDNYPVTATVWLKNTSSQPLALPAQEWFVGTAAPLGGRDKGQAVGVMWYNGATPTQDHGHRRFDLLASGGCKQAGSSGRVPRRGQQRGVGGGPQPVLCAGGDTGAARPGLVVRPARFAPSHRRGREPGRHQRPAATGLRSGDDLSRAYPRAQPNRQQPGESVCRAKEYQTRPLPPIPNNLDRVMNFGWAGFVSKALLLGMNWLHSVLSVSYGWAIVAITVIIKLVFWPLTQASTRSMKRMQALQPQMNEIKVKYKDDPVKMNKKTMEFMREHKVSPLGGCLPMALQIPVFFGFFSMIQSAIELRGAHFLWIGDLSQTDTLFVIPGLDFIPFFGIPGVGLPFNLLPLIMGATMIWQSHLTPPSPGMDPTQQKMMRYMPLMFLVFLYNYSAGLTLYWTVQNLLTILQTKLTKMAPGTPAPAQGSALTPPQKKRK